MSDGPSTGINSRMRVHTTRTLSSFGLAYRNNVGKGDHLVLPLALALLKCAYHLGCYHEQRILEKTSYGSGNVRAILHQQARSMRFSSCLIEEICTARDIHVVYGLILHLSHFGDRPISYKHALGTGEQEREAIYSSSEFGLCLAGFWTLSAQLLPLWEGAPAIRSSTRAAKLESKQCRSALHMSDDYTSTTHLISSYREEEDCSSDVKPGLRQSSADLQWKCGVRESRPCYSMYPLRCMLSSYGLASELLLHAGGAYSYWSLLRADSSQTALEQRPNVIQNSHNQLIRSDMAVLFNNEKSSYGKLESSEDSAELQNEICRPRRTLYRAACIVGVIVSCALSFVAGRYTQDMSLQQTIRSPVPHSISFDPSPPTPPIILTRHSPTITSHIPSKPSIQRPILSRLRHSLDSPPAPQRRLHPHPQPITLLQPPTRQTHPPRLLHIRSLRLPPATLPDQNPRASLPTTLRVRAE